MPYTAPILAQAKAALAARLNDPDMVRWVDAELGVYIREALRVWNAWTAHWRARGTFQTTQLQPFYDLSQVLPTLRPFSVTNFDVISEIEYMLLEPPTPSQWTGTDQFDLETVASAVQRRRDLFLQQTGAVVTRTSSAFAATADGRLTLPDAVMTVRRLAWLPDTPSATQWLRVLRRTDEFAADHFLPIGWVTVGTPIAYSTSVTPPLEVQLMPPPAVGGTLDRITVDKGADLVTDPATEVSLGIPDDWCWVVKYGALADLLGADGLASDPIRAKYCQDRWAQGVSMAQSAAVVLSVRVGGQVAPIGAVSDADSYAPLWQLLGGVPRQAALMGQNLLALIPTANADGYAVQVDVVRNAPVPAADADVLDVGADLYDLVLDLAQCAATFKEGPAQNQAAQALLQRAAEAAGIELAIQQASQPSRAPLMIQTRQDEQALPRVVDPVETP